MGPGGSTALWPPEGNPALSRGWVSGRLSLYGTSECCISFLSSHAPAPPHQHITRSLTSTRRSKPFFNLNSSTSAERGHLKTSDFEQNQAGRMISTSKLHMLPHFHFWPINVVVFHDPSGKTHLGRSLALRCFQRLSRPHLATRPCR